MQIRYLGFQLKPRGRDYNYQVIDAKAPVPTRDFTFTISNQAFTQHSVPYQDAPDICYQKLRKQLDLETAGQSLPPHATISGEEFDEYRAKHRPAKRRSW